MYHVLSNSAGAGGNGNGFNMNRKLICEFFPPPAPQSYTNTFRISLFSTPLLSHRTLPLIPCTFFFTVRYLQNSRIRVEVPTSAFFDQTPNLIEFRSEFQFSSRTETSKQQFLTFFIKCLPNDLN